MKKSRKDTSRRGWITKSIRVSSDERQLSPTEIAIKEDREVRKEIRSFIIQKHKQGMKPEEILKRLNFVYGLPKYQKYQPYYKSWIDNIVQKGQER